MAQRTWRTICRAVKSGANNFSRMAVSLMSQYTPIRRTAAGTKSAQIGGMPPDFLARYLWLFYEQQPDVA
jgi:hypothetical protein